MANKKKPRTSTNIYWTHCLPVRQEKQTVKPYGPGLCRMYGKESSLNLLSWRDGCQRGVTRCQYTRLESWNTFSVPSCPVDMKIKEFKWDLWTWSEDPINRPNSNSQMPRPKISTFPFGSPLLTDPLYLLGCVCCKALETHREKWLINYKITNDSTKV